MAHYRDGSDDFDRGDSADRALVDGLCELTGHLARQDWTTGDPRERLLPRLRVACDLPGSPWRLIGSELLPGDLFALDVRHVEPRGPRVLPDAITLLSCIAGPTFFVRQVDAVTVECATGVLNNDSPRPEGYRIRLRLEDPGLYDETWLNATAYCPLPTGH